MESSWPDNRQIANALTSKAPIKTKRKKSYYRIFNDHLYSENLN